MATGPLKLSYFITFLCCACREEHLTEFVVQNKVTQGQVLIDAYKTSVASNETIDRHNFFSFSCTQGHKKVTASFYTASYGVYLQALWLLYSLSR